ncbi:hypothetical protein APS_1595 [Acetobacter pasteurianus subsp. pasteurianus LMG 1262 = NBRC 106471]|nr:hypothetical protein APS_1595 [Acetobacter pasteurianus subsp. pasteurianus LMG 1262 = NBRC 106471]
MLHPKPVWRRVAVDTRYPAQICQKDMINKKAPVAIIATGAFFSLLSHRHLTRR